MIAATKNIRAITVRNNRIKKRLEDAAVEGARHVLLGIKRDYLRIMRYPRKAQPYTLDFADKYGRAIANEAMKAYLAGWWEQIRLHERKAMFSVSFGDFADVVYWVEILDIMGDKIPVDAEYFYSLDATLRAKYFTIAGVKELSVIEGMADLIAKHLYAGGTIKEFEEAARLLFTTSGLDPLQPHHLRQVLRTNSGLAYGAARDDFIIAGGFQDEPMIYIHSGQEVPPARQPHVNLDGVVQSWAEWDVTGLIPLNGYN